MASLPCVLSSCTRIHACLHNSACSKLHTAGTLSGVVTECHPNVRIPRTPPSGFRKTTHSNRDLQPPVPPPCENCLSKRRRCSLEMHQCQCKCASLVSEQPRSRLHQMRIQSHLQCTSTFQPLLLALQLSLLELQLSFQFSLSCSRPCVFLHTVQSSRSEIVQDKCRQISGGVKTKPQKTCGEKNSIDGTKHKTQPNNVCR